MIKPAILLTAFGAGGQQGQQALRFFDASVKNRFTGYAVRWAFTSEIMRNRLTDAKKKTDSVHKALCRLGFEKYTHVAIQPLQVIPGLEYENLWAEIQETKQQGAPPNITVGAPLLDWQNKPRSIDMAGQAILSHLPARRLPHEAIICVGHGSRHDNDHNYFLLGEYLNVLDKNIFIGTLAGKVGIKEVAAALSQNGIHTAWLLPLLSVLGKHALQDMNGSGPDSWRSVFEAAGLACTPVAHGLAEYPAFAAIWLQNLQEAVAQLEQFNNETDPKDPPCLLSSL